MDFKSFIDQCYKRKIFKGFSIYALVSWVIIQVAATTFPYLGIPLQTVTFIIIMVLIGLPISLIFSWYYNVIPEEIEDANEQIENEEIKVEKGDRSKSALNKSISADEITEKAASNIFKLIIAGIVIIVLLIVGILVRNNFIVYEPPIVIPEFSDRIAVMEFDNLTGKAEHNLLGKAISDWISHGIAQNKIAKVISSDIISNYSNAIESSNNESSTNVLLEKLAPREIIKGGIYTSGENLVLKCVIYDGKNEETLYAFEDFELDPENPSVGISKLNSKVLGYLAAEETASIDLQGNPPNYDAFINIIKAKENTGISDPEALKLINKALEIDSNYFEAKVLRLSHYYGIGDYAKADSLRRTIKTNSASNARQINLLNFYSALLTGKNKLVYTTWKNEYEYAPFDITGNRTMMVLAQQYIFKPEEIEYYYNEIDMEGMDLQTCFSCIYRLYIKALSDIELRNYKSAIELLEPRINVNVDKYILEALISAYIESGRDADVKKLFDELPNLIVDRDWSSLFLHAAKEYIINGQDKKASNFIDLGKIAFLKNGENYNLAKAHMYEGNFEEAKQLLYEMDQAGELSIYGKSNLAICCFKTGEIEKGNEIYSYIDSVSREFKFGDVEYTLAYIHAFRGQYEEALTLLKRAVEQGYIYGFKDFHHDLAFKEIKDDSRFRDLLTYWH